MGDAGPLRGPHHAPSENWQGLLNPCLIKTDDLDSCCAGEWESTDAIVAKRPAMISELDKVRQILAAQGNGLDLADPVSSDIVLHLRTEDTA